MSLQVDKAVLSGFRNEFCIHVLVPRNERDIHDRTVFRDNCAAEQLGMVEKIINHAGFFPVDLLHFLQAANSVFQPVQHKAADINGIAGRSVEHGTVVGMSLIIHHGRGRLPGMANQILPDNHHGQAGGAHIFLRACIQDAKPGNIQRGA